MSTVVPLLAAATSLGLAGAALLRRPRSLAQWTFALGMLGLCLESVAAFMLLARTETLEERLLWLRAWRVTSLLLLVPWGIFVGTLCNAASTRWPLGWRGGIAGGAAVTVLGAAAMATLPAFQLSDLPGPFYAARLDTLGWGSVIVELLATVAILGSLEACLRTSTGTARWRIKYLVLGLGGIFLVRFFLLSQLLLFHVLLGVYLATGAATLAVGNLVVAASVARDRLLGAELTVSRRIVYRSVVVGVLGLYLLALGALGWFLSYLGIPEELFWGSLLVFVSALGLATLLFSENVRWRIKRFISLNFYRSKYDYREQWSIFTKRLGSLLTVEELGPQIIAAVTHAVGTNRGVLYLADERGAAYHLAGTVEVDDAEPVLVRESPLIQRLAEQGGPLLLEAEALEPGAAPLRPLSAAFGPGAVAVPLRWRESLVGLMLVGPERGGAPYALEDFEFLATVGEQAAGAIVTARLSETAAQAREFDAFHRLTSFVIHDLKNSVSALSMLSQNALRNFEDPEFQRDAVKTLSRTVDRMRALMGRLASSPDAAALRLQPVDLGPLVRDVLMTIVGHPKVSLVTDLAAASRVNGDAEALLRVVQNLVTNAVEAVEGQGVVSVKTYEEPGRVVLAVADTGCGIPEAFLRKSLFAPFRSTKKGGWGIGLYQTKGIVEAHGGTLEVASREGEGTTFWVKLPSAPAGAGERG